MCTAKRVAKRAENAIYNGISAANRAEYITNKLIKKLNTLPNIMRNKRAIFRIVRSIVSALQSILQVDEYIKYMLDIIKDSDTHISISVKNMIKRTIRRVLKHINVISDKINISLHNILLALNKIKCDDTNELELKIYAIIAG